MNFDQRKVNFKRMSRLWIYRSFVYLRLFSASKRAIPDFLVAGAQKAGTTSLYSQIVQNPGVIPSFRKKEIHYWDNPKNYRKGQLWYRAHFPLMKELKARSAITGEKTPNYLESPETIRKIGEEFPAIKLIILLRNPVERTISNYFMMKKRGVEELSLMDALMQEDERLASKKEYQKFGTERAYTIRSKYASSIKACLDNFPKEQIHIIDSNDYFKDPSCVLTNVFSFLAVPIIFENETVHKNLGAYEKDDTPLDVYAYLANYFQPLNEELYNLLGVNFGWENIPDR